jgi:hypothetical protein
LFPDSVAVTPEPVRPGQLPERPPVTATVAEWKPGDMRIALQGAAPKPSYLVVGENWYPDWHATIDGRPAPVLRADNTLLSVVLPPGAREVRFRFASSSYPRGKLVTAIALLISLALLAAPLWTRRRSTAHG